ncbi:MULTISPECIES: diacylglycerol/lipid kinase family protein [Olivibacter]|uniref:Diacylglycerol/lipid kinase family protein n=1 Tax=Olivibacter oleidegradans TaxID=760123 RepID=A0ABV6HJS5_9SPHI|nr:diacylglycerol kinase family protein [Olivibacter jilunii]
MKETILILHNPKAGDKDHQKNELVNAIKEAGYNAIYSSIRQKKWQKIDKAIDIILIVGGDGTVRKVASVLLKRTWLDKKLLLSLLPMGTANNVALTLGSPDNIKKLLNRLAKKNIKKVDVGAVDLGVEQNFFLESLGVGLLPKLMREMEKIKTDNLESKEDEISLALHTLLTISLSYEARQAHITIDGKKITGKYLLIEVLNICSIGPNLKLAPEADMTDGLFEVVLLEEGQRDVFIEYVKNVALGKTKKGPWKIIRGRDIQIQWDGTWIHVDDEYVQLKDKTDLLVEARPQILDFLS